MSVCEEAMDTSISMEVTLPDAVLDAALHHVANDQVDALKDDLATNPILIVASQFALERAYQGEHLTGGTLLHAAVYHNSPACANELLMQGADVNATTTDSKLWTPLHVASTLGHSDVVKALTKHGVDVDVSLQSDVNNSVTPLQLAVQSGRQEVVMLLLGAGAGVDIPDKTGHTPLLRAMERCDVELVKQLLEAGASPHVGNDGSNSLHFAADCHPPSLDIVRFLVQEGANANTRNSSGKTAGDVAEANGHLAIVEYLGEVCSFEVAGEQQPSSWDRVMILVKGCAGSGKSTLINTLKPSTGFSFQGLFSREQQATVHESDESGHSLGIQAVTYVYAKQVPPEQQMTFVDFAGQKRFLSSHSRFGANRSGSDVPSVLLLVISAKESAEEINDMADEAISEFCAIQPALSEDRVRRPPGVIFVCTHIDEASDVDQARMIATHADILHQFSNQADFFPTLLFIDARNTRNTDFTTLREALDRFAKESIQLPRQNLSLAKQIIDHLPEIRKSLGKAVVSKDEFMETAVSVIASKDGRPHFGLSDVLTKNSKRLLRILAAYMEIEYVSEANAIVLQPGNLFSTVVQALLTLRDANVTSYEVLRSIDKNPIVQHHHPNEIRRKDGPYEAMYSKVPKQAVIDTFADEAFSPFALPLAASLIAGEVVDDHLVCVDYTGSKCSYQHLGKWAFDAKYRVFAGRRFHSPAGTEVFIPGEVFSRAFCNAVALTMYRKFKVQYGEEMMLYGDGMAGRITSGDVEGCVMTRRHRRFLDIAVRSIDNNRRAMYALLHVMCSTVYQLHRDLCAGVQMRELILSPRELERHMHNDPDRDRFGSRYSLKTRYTKEEVMEALPTNSTLYCNTAYNTDVPVNTFLLPADHIMFLSPSASAELSELLCRDDKTPNWKCLAKLLRIGSNRVQALASTLRYEPQGTILREVINTWCQRGSGSTVRSLIGVLREDNAIVWSKVIAVLSTDLGKPLIGTPNLLEEMYAAEKSRREAEQKEKEKQAETSEKAENAGDNVEKAENVGDNVEKAEGMDMT